MSFYQDNGPSMNPSNRKNRTANPEMRSRSGQTANEQSKNRSGNAKDQDAAFNSNRYQF